MCVLTDAGAEVSVLSVAPVVVGVAVVAAHRLQLDLLDLHGLRDGCVGSCCRRRCQAWRRERRHERLHVSARAEPLHLQKLFQKPARLNNNKKKHTKQKDV